MTEMCLPKRSKTSYRNMGSRPIERINNYPENVRKKVENDVDVVVADRYRSTAIGAFGALRSIERGAAVFQPPKESPYPTAHTPGQYPSCDSPDSFDALVSRQGGECPIETAAL